MSKKETLRQVLGSDTTKKAVHAQAILDVLNTASDDNEAVELLTIVLLERDSVPKRPQTLSNKGLTTEEWNELNRSHTRLVNEYLQTSFFSTNTVEEFARKIWDFLKLFPDEKQRTFVFGTIMWSTPFVPYRPLPGTMVRMSQHEFDHILDANPAKKELIEFICRLPFSTTVELGSMLLQVIDDTKEKEVRVALLGQAIMEHRNQTIAAALRATGNE